MNIVFLFSDEHAASAMGNSGHSVVRTPNLDRLAEISYTFDNAYCNSPLSTPSRLSMLTGRYPHQIEAWDLGVIADQRRHQTWGHHLSQADYRTVLCGRTHFNGSDRLMGFSHRLLDDLPKWHGSSGRPPARRPNERRSSNSHVTECGPGNHAHTAYDRQVTDLALDFLKQCFYQPAVQVPLMLRLPANRAETGRVSQSVSLLDILPTLLDLAGRSAALPGRSLLDIARHEANRIDRPVFAEYHHMGMLNAGFMLKRGCHKLCYYVGHSPQLFDLSTDPTESHNLAENSNLVAKMEAELRLICDPEQVDRRAKADQARRRSALS